MTPREFVDWSQGYYGPWPKGMTEDIRDYLVEKLPEHLSMLKTVCLETIPTRIGQVNGYPPDVAKLIELADEVGKRMEAEARHAWEIEYAAKMLPAPEPATYGDLRAMDWSAALSERINSLAAAKAFK